MAVTLGFRYPKDKYEEIHFSRIYILLLHICSYELDVIHFFNIIITQLSIININ